MASIFIKHPETGMPTADPEAIQTAITQAEQLALPGALTIEVCGTMGPAKGQSIWFTQLDKSRIRNGVDQQDAGLWVCRRCDVAFPSDWRVKHVNWHFRVRRSCY